MHIFMFSLFLRSPFSHLILPGGGSSNTGSSPNADVTFIVQKTDSPIGQDYETHFKTKKIK
jgi:hypothetical protein